MAAGRLGVGAGDDLLMGVAAGAVAGHLGVGASVCRSRATWRRLQHEATPPSPMTKPSRPRSNGREAARVVVAPRQGAQVAEAARAIGVTAMSQPPATQRSTSPSRSHVRPISRAKLLDAQAAERFKAGPVSSRRGGPAPGSRRNPGRDRELGCRRAGRPLPRAPSTRPRCRAPAPPAGRDAGPTSRRP